MHCFLPSIPLPLHARTSLHSQSLSSVRHQIGGTTLAITRVRVPVRHARMTISTTAAPVRPSQVVLDPLPRVYQYDHCPFCIRVRYALGVKNVKHELIWLHNDDIATPTTLVGKKMVPIFAAAGATGPAVPESLDIVRLVDGDARYGPTSALRPATGRTDITSWFKTHAETIRRLTRPRVVKAYLPEFATEDARAAFIRNHPLPEPSNYEDNIAKTDELVAKLQPNLAELDAMIFSEHFATEGGISLDDVDLFPRLRTLTLIKDLEWPKKMRKYAEFQSNLSDVGLYDVFAS